VPDAIRKLCFLVSPPSPLPHLNIAQLQLSAVSLLCTERLVISNLTYQPEFIALIEQDRETQLPSWHHLTDVPTFPDVGSHNLVAGVPGHGARRPAAARPPSHVQEPHGACNIGSVNSKPRARPA